MNAFRKVKRAALVAAAALILVACPSAAFADEVDTSLFMEGTLVNGVEIGGRNVPDAVSILRDHYSGYTLTIHEREGKTETLTSDEIGYGAEITDAMLANLLNEQNYWHRNPAIPLTDKKLGFRIGYDTDRIVSAVNALECVSGSSVVNTADAYVTEDGNGGYTVVPEVYGNSVDAEKLRSLALEAVKNGTPEIDLEASGCYIPVRLTKDDPAIAARLNALQNRQFGDIIYQVGDAVVTLDSGTAASFIAGSDASGALIVDDNALGGWLASALGTYTTIGRSRAYRAAVASGQIDAATTPITGIPGVRVNLAEEIAMAHAMIVSGSGGVRSLTTPDTNWGSSFVEVDMGEQHVYCFRDGFLVWEAPCVTGSTAKGRGTPEGFFSVYSKQRNRTLIGPGYASFVNYWMPFYRGCGLHDAPWRSSFGGSIYVNSGSHGCVNLPIPKAEELYGIVSVGWPVICHY